MMLAAGREVLYEITPTLGFETLTYSAVFDRLRTHHGQKVTIGSVHERIWKRQRDFQLDVLADVLSNPVDQRTQTRMTSALDVLDRLEVDTVDQRRYAAQTIVRLGSIHVLDDPADRASFIANTLRFRLWSLGEHDPEAEGFTDAITALRMSSTAAHAAMLRSLMQILGMRVRSDAGEPDEAIRAATLLSNATIVGLRTDQLPEASRPRMLPTGPTTEDEEWYPDAIAMWAIIRATFELADDGLTDKERQL